MLITFGIAAGSAACAAPSAGLTSTTAAELATSAPEAEPTHAAEAEPTRAPEAEAPAGRLVCRTESDVDGKAELFLAWSGPVAHGLLRRTVPSGMVYEQPVRAERYKGTIVVDEPECTDLVRHAAMVVEQNGKRFMRVGPSGQPVSACQ